ncbi:MAG: hypothetical protein AB1442_12430 [Nitrospirota bacterium]
MKETDNNSTSFVQSITNDARVLYSGKSIFWILLFLLFCLYIFSLSPLRFPKGYQLLLGRNKGDICAIQGCFKKAVTDRVEYFYAGKRRKPEPRSLRVCHAHQAEGSGTILYHIYGIPLFGWAIKFFLTIWGFILIPASILYVNGFLILSIFGLLKGSSIFLDLLFALSIFFLGNSLIPYIAKLIF